jgi:hypothetical protein
MLELMTHGMAGDYILGTQRYRPVDSKREASGC